MKAATSYQLPAIGRGTVVEFPAPEARDLKPDAGLYVHVPFCRAKCPYCGFFSVPAPGLVPRYVTALTAEMQLRRAPRGTLDTLYLGGGTPSCLPHSALERIVAELGEHFGFSADCERTIEVNPCDVAGQQAAALRDLGFNRVSLGVQSFVDRELQLLGRRHTANQARRAVARLRAAGFENLALDLIYGLPGQSLRSWQQSLEQALRLGPEHISCYQLSVEPKTPFARRMADGGLDLPGEECSRVFFVRTSEFLAAHGYRHYEVSNFALSDARRSRHNRKYWQRVPVVALGPAAHSFDGRSRRWNVASVRKYCGRLEAGRSPVAGEEMLSAEQVWLERLSLGWRTQEGVSLDSLPRTDETAATLRRLTAGGLLRVESDRAVPTREGLLVADYLPTCFF